MLMGCSGTAAWVWQANSYEKRLAVQPANHELDLSSISSAGAVMLQAEQVKRLALESELAANDQEHYKDLHNVQRMQARLRDRLATSDLRLSVILDRAATIGGLSVQPGSPAGSLVHGAARAQLDPAHAQRIVGIAGDGDRGLVALAACQKYAATVSGRK